MSGILDKKSRILDFVITENGRSQIEDGDIRYKFATLSDSSIIYTQDFEKSLNNKSLVSNSEFCYIPLEADTLTSSEINPEFDLGKYFSKTNSNILYNEESKNENNFNDSVDTFLTNFSLGSKLKNLKLLSTKNKINQDTKISFKDNGLLNINFDFANRTNKYKTIDTYKVKKENLPVVALDKRMSHKLNYKVMIPKDITGTNLYELDNFSNIENLSENNATGFLFTSYSQTNSKENNLKILSREKEISNIIEKLEKDPAVLKKVYDLEENSSENTFIFEIHESNFLRNSLDKLSFVKIGDFYDVNENKARKIYLVGKFLNSRENSNDLDVIFSFNNGNINLKNKSNFAISAFYSFVTMFTLVIE